MNRRELLTGAAMLAGAGQANAFGVGRLGRGMGHGGALGGASTLPPIDRVLPAINAVRNPTGLGAIVGTPGTIPTNWQKSSPVITVDVAATGTEAGIPYVDFRIHGTASGSESVGLYWETSPGIACIPGQTFTQQTYFKISAGSSPIGTKCTFQLSQDEFDASTGYLATDSGTDQEATGPTGAALNAQSYTQQLTMTNAGAAFTVPYVFMFFYGSGAIDFTLRVGQPSLVSNSGLLATRCYMPWLFTTANKQTMSRSAHFARDTISSLKIVIPNWYVDTTNNTSTYTELGSGATMSCTASVEFPAGTFTQIKFAGVATGTAATLKNLISDACSVAIPNGSQFWIRIFYTSTTGVLYATQGSAALGDVASFAASGLVDQTMSGTISGSAGFSFPPVAIFGNTTKKSAVLIGTSRTEGAQDTNDASGDLGVVARSIGPYAGYINGGIPGDSMAKFVLAHTNRNAITRALATDVWVEHGVNDNASNEATKETNIAAIWGYFLTKRVRALTVDPNTTGAWTNPTGSDQTVAQDFTIFNTFIKTAPAPLFAVNDAAPVVSISGTPTKWKAPGYTADGLHETQLANLAIASSHVVRF